MICPHCGFENAATSTYCERCSNLIQNFPEYMPGQTEYNVPPPPPLNGHNEIPLRPPSPIDIDVTPPPEEHGYGASSAASMDASPQTFTNQKMIASPRIGLFSGILYFAGILLAAFGLMGTATTFGTRAGIGSIALLLGIALVIAGVVVFMRIRRHFPHLHWWQRILWILALTAAAFIALIIEVLVSPNPTLTNYFTTCVILLYGLIWAAIAVW